MEATHFKRYPTKNHAIWAWLIVFLGALFYCYEYFLRISPSVMSHNLMSAYHISAEGFGKLAAFYYFAYTPMQLFVGVLFDRYGIRLLLTGAVAVCVIGTAMFASTHYLGIAEIGRFLIGFGSAFAFVGALKLATVWLPPQRFAAVSGMIASLGTLGAILGDVTLTKLVAYEGWQTTLYLSAGLGLILALALFIIVRDNITTHNESPILPSLNLKQVTSALIHSLSKPQFWLNGVIGGLLYLTLSAFAELWGIPYVHQTYGLSSTAAASAVSITFLGWTIGGPLLGSLSDYFKRRRIILMTGSLLAAITISLVLYIPSWSLSILYLLLFLFGAFASAQVIVFAIGREVADSKIAGTAIAFTNMLIMLGGALYQPLIGRLLDYHWSGNILHHVRIYSLADYRFALSALPIAMGLSFILTFFLKETHCQLTTQKEDK